MLLSKKKFRYFHNELVYNIRPHLNRTNFEVKRKKKKKTRRKAKVIKEKFDKHQRKCLLSLGANGSQHVTESNLLVEIAVHI